jgi:tetratricopeptide (TPR) repeat protein
MESRRGEGVFEVLGQPARFSGREAELALLDGVLERAVTYQAPQLVTVVGGQGVGKSRLGAEWVRRLEERAERVRVLRGRADQKGRDYGVFERLLRDRFALGDGEDPAVQAERLRVEVAEVFGDRRVAELVHFLGSFVALPLRESAFQRAVREDPRQHDQIARTVLRRFLERDAERGPLLLILDDLQWADERSLGLVDELAGSLAGSPIVLLALVRPELLTRAPRLASPEGDHIRLELEPLPPGDAERMLRALLERADDVPAELVAQGVAMTGGNPFFIEQLVRLCVSDGTIARAADGRWRIDAARAARAQLPMTVEDAVAARIAGLSRPHRELLERAAPLGNVFWTGALVALTRLFRSAADGGNGHTLPAGGEPDAGRAEVEALLAELAERDYILLIPDSSIAGEAEYCFKHNLERELIGRLTEPERVRRYHLHAAQWLEARLGECSDEQLEALAQLYERGGNRRRAAYLLVGAADRARARYANEAAMALYQRGLALLDDGEVLQQIDALHNLGDVCALVGQAERALEAFTKMLRWAELLDLRPKVGAAHGRIGRLYRQRGELERALEHLERAHELFGLAGDKRGVAGALDDVGKVHWLRGDYEPALGCCRQALGLRREVGDLRSIALSLSNIGRVHHDSGAFKAALECFDEALQIRREIDDKPGEIRSLWDLGRVNEALEDDSRAYALYRSAYDLAREIGDRLAQAHLLANMGQAKLHAGDAQLASDHLGEAGELAQSLGDRLLLSECSRSLGETFLLLGDREAAREQCRQALELAQWVRSRPHIGAALRALAHLAAAGGVLVASDEPAALFERAIGELAEVGNELELARCYREFADYQERRGQLADARGLRGRAEEITARLRGAASASGAADPVALDLGDLELPATG